MKVLGRAFKNEPKNANCYALFRSRFPKDLSKTFIDTEDGRMYSFADLEDISGRFVRLFEHLGLNPENRVVVQVEKSPEAVFLYVACLRFCGIVFVPLESFLQEREIEYILQNATPSLIICQPEKEGVFNKLACVVQNVPVRTLGQFANGSLIEESQFLPPRKEVQPMLANDIACILYTSGTTGRQKGAMLTHLNLASNAFARNKVWNISSRDVLLHIQDISHISGINAVNLCLSAPCRMFFLLSSKTDTIIKYLPEVTIFMGGPRVYKQLLDHSKLSPALCRHTRLFIFLTTALPEGTFRQFKEKTGIRIMDRYGMTETGINTSNSIQSERIGSVGKLLPGIEMRIADDQGTALPVGESGNIEVRGPNVFKGYWNDLEKTKQAFRSDGFFITGDLGKLDEDGYLWIVGRAKDVVIVTGTSIYPKEIEGYIDIIAGVEESAVFGVPDPIYGERLIAAIKRKADADDLTEEIILEKLKREIAAYKIPSHIYFVEHLPRNEMGKVQKRILQATYKDQFV